MAETKTLLLLALAGGAGYYFYNKSTSTTTTPAADSTPGAAAASGAETGGATLNPAAAALATAVNSPALRDVPDDVAQLALRVNVDLATTLAVARFDAIIHGHPDQLSTQYFLADGTGPQTWQDAVQAYNESGLTELAQQVGIDPATVLAVVARNYTPPVIPSWFYNGDSQKQMRKAAMAQLITSYKNDQNTWSTAYASYQAANGLSGFANLLSGESALNAVSSALVWDGSHT